MTTAAQKIAKALGESGCYFFSLCKVAEDVVGHKIDPIEAAARAMELKTLGSDCFVKDAGAIFSMLVGERFGVLKAGPGHTLPLEYAPRPGEREILRYEITPERAHFVVGDGSGRLAWDPWPGSEAVRTGRMVSKRIIRRMP